MVTFSQYVLNEVCTAFERGRHFLCIHHVDFFGPLSIGGDGIEHEYGSVETLLKARGIGVYFTITESKAYTAIFDLRSATMEHALAVAGEATEIPPSRRRRYMKRQYRRIVEDKVNGCILL